MFETMIHSTEELNAMAVHLRLSENFSELKLLASEWLVPDEHVQDFIAGKRVQLAEIPFEEGQHCLLLQAIGVRRTKIQNRVLAS